MKIFQPQLVKYINYINYDKPMRIRAYLTLMAIAILAPVVVSSIIALKILQNTARAESLQSLHESTRKISQLVDQELYSAEAALHVLAASPSLESEDLQSFYAQALTANRGPDAWTVLLDENGRQLSNTSHPADTPLDQTEKKSRVLETLESRKTIVSDLFESGEKKRLITTLKIPVTTKSGKNYVLAEVFDTNHFTNLISHAGIPAGWSVGLLDKHGYFIARNINPKQMIGKVARPELVTAARHSLDGTIHHETWEHVSAYDSFTHSTMSRWTIAVAVPAELIEHTTLGAPGIAALGIFLGIFCAVAAGIFFGRIHVREIQEATKAAVDLGNSAMPVLRKSNVQEVNTLHAALGAAGIQIIKAQAYRKQVEAARQSLLDNEHQARQLAENQNKAKDEFLAMLGHELRNPLAPISMAAQLLKLPQVTNEKVNYASDVIARQVRHMNRLIGDLLDVSRVTRGLITLNVMPMDLNVAIKEALEQAQPAIEAKRQRLDISVPKEGLWIYGDQTRVIQIIANILNNAIKFTPDGGMIELQAGASSDWIALTVRDNGIGIPDDLMPHIFELFAQGKRQSDRSQGGMGLGLALVKSLVELHGGEIAAQSDGENLGSVFTLRMPTRARGEYIKPVPEVLPDPAGSERIMIVDDNVDAAESLALILQAAGHEVRVFPDPQSAIADVIDYVPQVCILDIGLPVMDGYELVRRLRKIPETKNALMIALTGYGRADDKKRSREAGFDHHLVKPAEPGEILALLEDTPLA